MFLRSSFISRFSNMGISKEWKVKFSVHLTPFVLSSVLTAFFQKMLTTYWLSGPCRILVVRLEKRKGKSWLDSRGGGQEAGAWSENSWSGGQEVWHLEWKIDGKSQRGRGDSCQDRYNGEINLCFRISFWALREFEVLLYGYFWPRDYIDHCNSEKDRWAPDCHV